MPSTTISSARLYRVSYAYAMLPNIKGSDSTIVLVPPVTADEEPNHIRNQDQSWNTADDSICNRNNVERMFGVRKGLACK